MTATAAARASKGAETNSEKGVVSILVTCMAISPILMNPMTDETINGLITGNRPQLNKDRRFEDVARDRIYIGENGVIGVPTMNLIAALKHAGRAVKHGKKAISTATSTTLFSFVEFPDEFLPFLGQENGVPLLTTTEVVPPDKLVWKVDKRRGVMRNGASQIAVGILRPRFHNWRFNVRVILNEKLVGQDTLRKMFDEAGTNAGLGDFRPQKGGPFGRFKVVGWTAEPVSE